MVKIGVIGSIGVGKSTFIKYLVQALQELEVKTFVFGEPAMEDPDTHQILLKFYADTLKYAYDLEVSITSVYNRYYRQVSAMEERGEDGVVIVDGLSNSDIFSRIFYKNNIFTEAQKDEVLAMVADFDIDVMIYLQESAEETIRRIKKRDRGMEMSNLDYIYDHVRDYETVIPHYLAKRFPRAKVLRLKDFPDVTTPEYHQFVKDLARLITSNGQVETIDFKELALINP